jgi:hypothetical protein
LRDDFAIVTDDDDDDDEEENFTLLLLLLDAPRVNRVLLVVTVVVDATDNMFVSVFNRNACACGTKYNL